MFHALLAPNQGRGDAQGRSMVTEETEEAPKLPPDARLESLDRRLDRAQEAEVAKTAKAQSDPNMRIAQVVIGYLIGGPLGGGLIGWGLDSLFGTRPWLMLLMIFLGFAAGVRSILRISKAPSGRSGTDL
jgi:ATP synthase protein I